MSKIIKAFRQDSNASNVFRGAHWFVIVDRYPRFVMASRKLRDDEIPRYDRQRNKTLYYSVRNGFVRSYVHSPGTSGAFGGGKIVIKTTCGDREFSGDLWSAGQGNLGRKVVPVGLSTRRRLKSCYVYYGEYIDEEVLGKWLDENPNKIESYGRGKL